MWSSDRTTSTEDRQCKSFAPLYSLGINFDKNCEPQKCEYFENQIELMVHVIGASSLRRTVDKAPTTLQ